MADKNIKIQVIDKKATVIGTPVIVCGNSDYTATFTFDGEWSLTGPKTARFVYVRDGVAKHEDVAFSGNVVAVPVLENVAFVDVGVFAGNLCTTTPARVPCKKSILCGSGAPHDPTPDIYDQIMKLFEDLAAAGGFGATEAQARQIEKNKQDIAQLGTTKAEQTDVASLTSTVDQNTQDIVQLETTKAAQTDLAALAARMDTFTHLEEGSTTGDAELADIRAGYDGTQYATAGAAVRGQANALAAKIETLTDARPSENLFSRACAYHWYRASDGVVKESAKTLTFVVPFTGKEFSILNPFFAYSSGGCYMRFLSSMPEIGDNLAECQLASVKLLQEYQIRQVAEGTKYIWLTVRDESVNDTYTEQEVFEKCMLLNGAYKREYIPPVVATVSKNILDSNLLNMVNTLYDCEPGVYSTSDSSVVAPSFVGNPAFMLSQLKYTDVIELFNSLNLGMEKSIIGYATTASGEEDPTRPIYCYSLRNPLNRCKGFYPNGRRLLVIAGQHGDEKNGVYGLYKILKEYADGVSLYLSDMLDRVELDIIPVVNPYGFDNNTRNNARNVNINRNFDYYWADYESADKGPAKESEHETQAIVRFIEAHVGDYYGLVDIHCSTRYQGTEQLMAQMFANSTTLRQHFCSQISRCNRKWKKKYNMDIIELQIGRETDKNGAANKNGGLTGEIGNIPQLAGWFTQTTQRFACEIECPKHITTYVGASESGSDISNGYKYLWYGYPTPQISMDVIAATLSAFDKTMELLYSSAINYEPIQGAEGE